MLTNLDYAILSELPPLHQAKKGGVVLEKLVSFLITVMASVFAYYICKWLDGDDNGNEPKV